MNSNALQNAIWHALRGAQAGLGEVHGLARRYRASVAPFASLDENTPMAWDDLSYLVQSGEAAFVLGEKPLQSAHFRYDASVPLLQMILPPDKRVDARWHGLQIDELSCADSPDMMELISIAFPGYFREETCRMGRYFGVRQNGKLIAMGGERIMFEADGTNWREVSALATHPEHTGHGLGSALLQHIVNMQRALGAVPFLHVIENNTNAIRLYESFGFVTVRRVELHKLIRLLS